MNSVLQQAISSMGKYLQLEHAEKVVESYCEKRKLTLSDFKEKDIGFLVLHIAAHRRSIANMNDRAFLRMMNDLICLSNSYTIEEEPLC